VRLRTISLRQIARLTGNRPGLGALLREGPRFCLRQINRSDIKIDKD